METRFALLGSSYAYGADTADVGGIEKDWPHVSRLRARSSTIRTVKSLRPRTGIGWEGTYLWAYSKVANLL